jgi:hypothetical protein
VQTDIYGDENKHYSKQTIGGRKNCMNLVTLEGATDFLGVRPYRKLLCAEGATTSHSYTLIYKYI